MPGGIFDSEEIRCWGRGDEIEYLLGPIHDPQQARSLTLIWGDSGIGKTTLLEEFHRRVAGGDYLAGFYECQRDTSADPLLKCLQKLLEKRIYTLDQWPDLIIQGLSQVKDRLQNPQELGRLFSGALGAVGEAPVVGKWAKVVSKVLGVAADVAGPRTTIPSQMIERLAPEVFADIVDVLGAAFAGRPLIFILDNLSAVAESQAPTAGVTGATDALLSFVQTQFLKRRDVHFVLSWKHIAQTRPSFNELLATIKQYQGRDRELGVLSDPSVDQWARHDFEWFREASAEEREQAVRIADGLPEAVAQWKEQGVDRFEPTRLQEITDGVVQGRNAPLEAELRDSELAEDKPRLFQLSLMPQILTERGLAQLWACEPQQVHVFLRTWCERALLKTQDGRYLFAHEKKREVARRVLAEELFHGGRDAARALHDFYLANVGFPSEAQPEAGYYLAFALALHPWAGLTEGETQLLSESLALLSDSGPALNIRGAALEAAMAAPWNTRFFLWHKSALGLPETRDLLERLGKDLLDDDAAAKSDPVNLAQGLFHATSAYGKAGRLEEVERLLGRLRETAGRFPEDAAFAALLMRGLVLSSVLGIGDMERNAAEVAGLVEKYGESEAFADALGLGAELDPGASGQECESGDEP